MPRLVYLRLFRWLTHFGPATCHCLAAGLGERPSEISTRLCYLAELGLVEPMGRRKPVEFRVTVLGAGVWASMKQRAEADKALIARTPPGL